MRATWFVVLGLVLLGGCATVVEGTSQVVTIDSDPQGAQCRLSREGRVIGQVATPGAVRVDKSSNPITVLCNKDGYEEGGNTLTSTLAAAFGGNVLIGGAIGLMVDAASGAAVKYDDISFVTLVAKAGTVRPTATPASLQAPASSTPATPNVAAFAAPIGQEFRNAIEIGAVQVALLDGTWQLAGNGVQDRGSNWHAVTLVRIEQGKLWGITRIWTGFRSNPNGGGYSAYKLCDRQDVLFTQVASNVAHGDQDCWIVNHNVMDEPPSASAELHVRQAREYLASRDVAVPGTLINITHRFAASGNFFSVWYQVNPEFYGFPPGPGGEWRRSGWHRDRYAVDAKRVALIQSFKRQHAEYHDYLRRGFAHQLGDFTARALVADLAPLAPQRADAR